MLLTLAMLFGLSLEPPSSLYVQNERGGEVDVELVLAADVSRSMDYEEIEVQRSGYVAALQHPDFINAVRGGLIGRIAISYFEWAGTVDEGSLVGWQIIETVEDAEAFAAKVAARPVITRRGTSISEAVSYGATLIHSSNFNGMRKVIDVSGDGANNIGSPIVPVRDAVTETGIVINGLAIMIRPSGAGGSLDRYYADCVIGGPGAFVLPVHTMDDFAIAVRRKLVMEISGLPLALKPQHVNAQATADCLSGERQRFDFFER